MRIRVCEIQKDFTRLTPARAILLQGKNLIIDIPISANVIRGLVKSGRLKSNRTHDWLAITSAVRGLLNDLVSGKEPMPVRKPGRLPPLPGGEVPLPPVGGAGIDRKVRTLPRDRLNGLCPTPVDL